MKKLLFFLIAFGFLLCTAGVAGAIPQTVNFTDYPDLPTTEYFQLDADTTAVNDWFYTNYGLTFSNVYLYGDPRDTVDGTGVANDTSGMPDYNGGTGYLYFADTTDYVTVDWFTISAQDINVEVYNADDVLLDSFFQEGSGSVMEGSSTLNGTGISYLRFFDGGGQVALSTISYDYDGYTDGTNDDVNQVPEPSTMLLLGIGLVGIVGPARKKFKN